MKIKFYRHYLKKNKKNQQLYDPFLWMGFKWLKARGGSLRFTNKFPEIPGTHFTDLGRMKG